MNKLYTQFLFLIKKETKDKAMVKCAQNGLKLTHVINEYLDKWVKK